jgi:DNA-binding PadR family transcriptional regulator
MHIIGSALSDNRFKQKLLKYINSHLQNNLIVRFDPALNRALEYALADEMIVQQGNGTYKLTDKGKKLAQAIVDDTEIFKSEKDTLNEISLNLTEDRIKEISERWKYQNAEN